MIAPQLKRALNTAVFVSFGVLAYFQIETASYYVNLSRSLPGSASGFLEIPGASYLDILKQMDNVKRQIPAHTSLIISDTYNIVLGEIESDYTQGYPLLFPAADFNTIGPVKVLLAGKDPYSTELMSIRDAKTHDKFFPVRRYAGDKLEDQFKLNSIESAADLKTTFVLKTSQALSLFNRFDQQKSEPLSLAPYVQTRNYACFIDSLLGPFYADLTSRGTLFQLEPDYYDAKQTMAGVGRFLLIEILNPSAHPRLEISFTSSLDGDHVNKLPPASIVGSSRSGIDFAGSGAARVISDPIDPLRIDGRSFLLIDFGIDGKQFKEARSGLFGLFGKSIALDNRFLVGFARDFSVVSSERYATVARPSFFAFQPGSIPGRELIFSGISEDGWLSQAGFLELTRKSNTKLLTMSGAVPLIGDSNFRTTGRLLVNGKTVADSVIGVGEFSLSATISFTTKISKVSWEFSKFQHLPGDDGRPVVAQLKSIGFK